MISAGALPPLTALTTVYSQLPFEAFQNPGCSAADMKPNGRLSRRKSLHCFNSTTVSGMSIQMKSTWARSRFDFNSPGVKAVLPVGYIS